VTSAKEPDSDKEPDKEPNQTGPSAALGALLDRHGFGFQYAVVQHIRGLSTPWSVESTEFPVSGRSGSTHIDFVLLNGASPAFRWPVRIVAECKRANPSLIDWCFVRTPHVPQDSIVALEVVGVRNEPASRRPYAAVDRRNGWVSERVYNLAFAVKGSAAGDPCGDDRTAIDSAVAQVLRGAAGLMEFLAHDSRALLRQYEQYEVGYVVPAIFTTARLWGSDARLDTAELLTGKVPPSTLRPLDWLWLKVNVSPAMKPALEAALWDDNDRFRTLRDYVLRDYSRCIAIVSAAGTESFLRMGHWSI
jgi:hypothetical protein